MQIASAALIGDVHAEDEILASVLDFLSTQPIDAILCTGDIVDGPGDPNRCAALLREAGAICVRGNHDRWALAGSMREMPDAVKPRVKVIATNGSRSSETEVGFNVH